MGGCFFLFVGFFLAFTWTEKSNWPFEIVGAQNEDSRGTDSWLVYREDKNERGQIRPDFQSSDKLQGDLKPIVEKWQDAGIQILYTGVSPWDSEY